MPTIVLMIGVVAVGSAAVLARFGLDAGMSAVYLAAWRLTLASLMLLIGLGLFHRGKKGTAIPRADWSRLAIAGVCLGLHFLTWIASLDYISVARSTLMVTTSPLWAGIAGIVWLKKPPIRTYWLGLAVAAAGVLLINNTHVVPTVRFPGHAWKGDLLAIAGAMLVVPYMFLTKRLQQTIDTTRTVAYTYTFAAMSLWICAIGLQGVRIEVPMVSGAWFSVIGMAIVPQLIGHTAINFSLKTFSPHTVAAAMLLDPLIAAGLAFVAFSERIDLLQGIGAIVLLAGVAIALRD